MLDFDNVTQRVYVGILLIIDYHKADFECSWYAILIQAGILYSLFFALLCIYQRTGSGTKRPSKTSGLVRFFSMAISHLGNFISHYTL